MKIYTVAKNKREAFSELFNNGIFKINPNKVFDVGFTKNKIYSFTVKRSRWSLEITLDPPKV